jgi:hypothetical protein
MSAGLWWSRCEPPEAPGQRIVAMIGKLPGLDRKERIVWD